MEYAKFETAALAHVNDEYYFGAYCGKCKHHARLSLVKLRARLGDDFRLIDVRERLRCQRCRSRHVVFSHLQIGTMGTLPDCSSCGRVARRGEAGG